MVTIGCDLLSNGEKKGGGKTVSNATPDVFFYYTI
jgi:hypothetical protein